MKVSVLILTHNEETNLPRCLSALSWCDDILVLDSGSSDRTVELARASGARVLTRPFDTFAAQRNYGLDVGELRHDWVLHLDADEVVTTEFYAALQDLEPQSGILAYQVPSKTMLFGRWLKHAGMWPTYQVRIGHVRGLRFKQVGHGQREDLPPEQVGLFPYAYLHFSFSHGMERWLRKHIRYAADEMPLMLALRSSNLARGGGDGGPTARRRRAKASAAKLPVILRPAARFIYVYLVRQGFRDGRAGLAYALMLSVYEGMISIFMYEAMLRPDPCRLDADTSADPGPLPDTRSPVDQEDGSQFQK